jgi:hypothetical protein
VATPTQARPPLSWRLPVVARTRSRPRRLGRRSSRQMNFGDRSESTRRHAFSTTASSSGLGAPTPRELEALVDTRGRSSRRGRRALKLDRAPQRAAPLRRRGGALAGMDGRIAHCRNTGSSRRQASKVGRVARDRYTGEHAQARTTNNNTPRRGRRLWQLPQARCQIPAHQVSANIVKRGHAVALTANPTSGHRSPS